MIESPVSFEDLIKADTMLIDEFEKTMKQKESEMRPVFHNNCLKNNNKRLEEFCNLLRENSKDGKVETASLINDYRVFIEGKDIFEFIKTFDIEKIDFEKYRKVMESSDLSRLGFTTANVCFGFLSYYHRILDIQEKLKKVYTSENPKEWIANSKKHKALMFGQINPFDIKEYGEKVSTIFNCIPRV